MWMEFFLFFFFFVFLILFKIFLSILELQWLASYKNPN